MIFAITILYHIDSAYSAISRLWKQCHKGQWRVVKPSLSCGNKLHFTLFFIILALASLSALAQKALSAQTGQIVQQQKKEVITDNIKIFELFCFRVRTHKPCAASSLLLSNLLELWPHLPPLGQELKCLFGAICLSVSKISQNLPNPVSWNFTHTLGPWKGDQTQEDETLSSKKVFRSLGASSGK